MSEGLARYPFLPDYATPPGETLRETLEQIGMSQAEFARRADLSTKHVNQIIQGEAPITVDTARALELVTRVPAEVWNGLEATYRATRLRQSVSADLSDDDRAWVEAMPVKELIRRDRIQDTKDMGARFEGLLRFFGVANRHGWEALWKRPEASFYRSTAFQQKPHATAAWLRLAELAADDIQTQPFDRQAVKDVAQVIRGWLREPVDRVLVGRIREQLANAGVAFVIVQDIPGSRASGVTRWVSADKVVIALSLRYKRDDRFWFTFFHEIGHVLLHGKRQTFIEAEGTEPDADPEETQASRFSADILIPRQANAAVLALTTEAEVEEFALEWGLPPGVVVGRMQNLRKVWNTPLNKLRKEIDPDELLAA